VAFITSSAEERYQEGEPAGSACNTRMRLFSDELRKANLPFIDQPNPMIAWIEKDRESGVLATREGANRLVPDGVHSNWDGKNDLFYTRWRDDQLANIPGWIDAAVVEAGRKKKLAELNTLLERARIDSLRCSQYHVWTVAPVP
jgi:hypothetical protein